VNGVDPCSSQQRQGFAENISCGQFVHTASKVGPFVAELIREICIKKLRPPVAALRKKQLQKQDFRQPFTPPIKKLLSSFSEY
jgi:hypothetical protein